MISEHDEIPDAATMTRSRVFRSFLLPLQPLPLLRLAVPECGSWVQKGTSSSISRPWHAGFDDAGPASSAAAHTLLLIVAFGSPPPARLRGGTIIMSPRVARPPWRGGRLREWGVLQGGQRHGWEKSPETLRWHKGLANGSPPSTPSRLAILAPEREGSQPASRESGAGKRACGHEIGSKEAKEKAQAALRGKPRARRRFPQWVCDVQAARRC
jgi:hypothetical protein